MAFESNDFSISYNLSAYAYSDFNLWYNLTIWAARDVFIKYDLPGLVATDVGVLYTLELPHVESDTTISFGLMVSNDLELAFDIEAVFGMVVKDSEVLYDLIYYPVKDTVIDYDILSYDEVRRDTTIQYHLQWEGLEAITYTYLRD